MTSAEPQHTPPIAPLSVALLNSVPQWGGGEKWCVEAGGALARRGHRVLVACARGSALEARAAEAGLPVWAHPVWGRLGWAPGATARLAARLSAEGVTAVIANVGRDLRLGARAARRASAHLLQRRGLLRGLKGTWSERRLYARVSRVIVNCDAIGARMRQPHAPSLAKPASRQIIPPERFFVLPNGVVIPPPIAASERAAARPALGLPLALAPEPPIALALGRLAPMKGHLELLTAWEQVRSRLPDARLLIGGTGELEGALAREVEARGLSPTVHLLGFQRDVRRLLAAASVFVCASVRDEGMNNAVLEAMAHGLPCVVTDCGGLPELVVHNETGLVVPAGQAEPLGAALASLLGDAATRARFGAAARARAEASFSEAHVTDLLEALLRDVQREPLLW